MLVLSWSLLSIPLVDDDVLCVDVVMLMVLLLCGCVDQGRKDGERNEIKLVVSNLSLIQLFAAQDELTSLTSNE